MTTATAATPIPSPPTGSLARSATLPPGRPVAEVLDQSGGDTEMTLKRFLGIDAWRRPTLEFSGTLEKIWRHHQAHEALVIQRWSALLSMALYLSYLVYTWFGHTRSFDLELMMIFAIFTVPPCVSLLIVSALKNGWRRAQSVAVIGAMWQTLGLMFFYQRASEMGLHLSTELLVLQIFLDLFLLGVGWSAGTALALVALFLSPLAASMVTHNSHETITAVFCIAAATMVGSLGAYLAERTKRVAWLQSRMLQHSAERDGLTQLQNHSAFYQQAGAVLKNAERTLASCSMLLLDVDHFKRYNDMHGHPAGDDCLRRVAREIRKSARRPLDVCGRLGGEEFGLMLPEADLENACTIAEDLLARIRGIPTPDGVMLTASCGVSTYSVGVDSVAEMVKRADTALYRAKRNGRNQICRG